jgi:Amt family ammonium transporter
MVSTLSFRWFDYGEKPDIINSVNGILMGLIVITPLAGFVSPLSAVVLGVLGGPIFIYGSKLLSKRKWFTDPVGLFPAHMLGGIFGVLMIAFFTQTPFAIASGNPTLPNGLLFGGGFQAFTQLGIEAFGIIVVMITVFLLSFATCVIIAKLFGGITADYKNRI